LIKIQSVLIRKLTCEPRSADMASQIERRVTETVG